MGYSRAGDARNVFTEIPAASFTFLKQYSLCCPSFGEEGFTYELTQIGKAKNLKKTYNKGLSEAEPSKNEGLQLLRTW